jgi:hypothetical protein
MLFCFVPEHPYEKEITKKSVIAAASPENRFHFRILLAAVSRIGIYEFVHNKFIGILFIKAWIVLVIRMNFPT